MSRKSIVICFLICVAVISAYVWVSRPEKETEKRFVLSFSETDVKEINVENTDETYRLYKKDGVWKSDRKRELLSGAVEEYFKNTLPMEGRKLENAKNSAEYGFENPDTTVTYTLNDGRVFAVEIGKNTPPDTETYVKCGNEIYTVYTDVSSELKKRLYRFTDTAIASFKYERIKSVSVEGSENFTLEKTSDGWKCGGEILSEEKVKQEVTRWFGNIFFVKCFDKTEENLKKYGFDSQSASVCITLANGDRTVIYLGLSDGENIYIYTDKAEEIYSVNAKMFDFIKNGIKDLKN